MIYKRQKNYWQQDISKYLYLRGILGGVTLIVAVSYLFYGSVWVSLILLPYLFFYLRDWEKKQIQKQKMEFRKQFCSAIQAISVALGVGYSAENALKEAFLDLQFMFPQEARIRKEFCYMIRQMEMNLPLEQIFFEFANRSGEEDVKTFATVFGMAKRSGGDLMEIIRSTVWQMGEKQEVKREIETLMAAKKMEFQIMSLVPFAMIGYIKWAFPDFMSVLYGNLSGIFLMSICLGVYILAYEWGKRMLEIEV